MPRTLSVLIGFAILAGLSSPPVAAGQAPSPAPPPAPPADAAAKPVPDMLAELLGPYRSPRL